NEFGALTEIRIDPGDIDATRAAIRAIDPARLGFASQEVRASRLASTDFGGLFLGLSIFIVVAALTLSSMLFVFGIESRGAEIGTMKAMGFTARRLHLQIGGEGAAVALVGSTVGALIGVGYADLVLRALSGIWSGAVASSAITLHLRVPTMILAGVIAWGIAAITIGLSMARLVRLDALDLLRGHGRASRARIRVRWTMGVLVTSVVGAVVVLAMSNSVGAFFGVGSLLLVAGFAASRLLLHRDPRPGTLTLGRLAVRHTTRNAGRSLATIVVLASGTFLIVSVSANQLGVSTTGAGGFDLFVTTSVPVDVDLAVDDDRRRDLVSGLDDATIVSWRVRDGDDASCLNLSVTREPRIYAADPEALAGRFEFVQQIDAPEREWALLHHALPDEAVPAIVDDASAKWTMKKGLGEGYTFIDENGESFEIVIVGTIANSILQGTLVIDQTAFETRFPSNHGFGAFTIQTDDPQRTGERLRFALADHGVVVESATERLVAFNAVQNTYLSIFRALGGVGLLLGTIGLGIVVARNVLERRTSLAQLGILGFTRPMVRRIVLLEHGALLGAGIAIGSVSSVVSVLPVLDRVPVLMLMGLLVAIVANGAFWIWLATRLCVPAGVLEVASDGHVR
ncbi:MAG: ABC transporter permease, partial [Phycisphaerales bacterium]|nr:ABC transporter permease [Phycisphaerales bacterium]